MFWQIKPEHSTVEISLQEKKENKKDFIIMQAFIFPYINILWIGCIVMVIGTLLAIVERLKRNV
jgi:cytochrome c-type biogenesis protein CcmF